MRYRCYYCSHKKNCEDKEDMGYTGCCRYEDYRAIRFLKQLFCTHFYITCEYGSTRCDKCNRILSKGAEMHKPYGVIACPFETDPIDNGVCYDYDRLGTLACGLCGANEKLAKDGLNNFIKGLEKNLNVKLKWYQKLYLKVIGIFKK